MLPGINWNEFAVILLVIVVVVGPSHLPEYAAKLGQFVRQARVVLDKAKKEIAEEIGPEFQDLDLSSLDPRQYDPRKIVRDALGEDLDAIKRDFASPISSVAEAAKDAATGLVPRSEPVSATVASDVAGGVKADAAASVGASPTVVDSAAHGDSSAADEPGEPVKDTSAVAAVGAAVAAMAVAKADHEDAPEAVADNGAAVADEDEGNGGPGSEEKSSDFNEDNSSESSLRDDEPESAIVVASSLVVTDEAPAPSVPRRRPVSPRDIVAAANVAARTRAEAAAAVLTPAD